MLAVIAFSYMATEIFITSFGQQRHYSKRAEVGKKSVVEESEPQRDIL